MSGVTRETACRTRMGAADVGSAWKRCAGTASAATPCRVVVVRIAKRSSPATSSGARACSQNTPAAHRSSGALLSPEREWLASVSGAPTTMAGIGNRMRWASIRHSIRPMLPGPHPPVATARRPVTAASPDAANAADCSELTCAHATHGSQLSAAVKRLPGTPKTRRAPDALSLATISSATVRLTWFASSVEAGCISRCPTASCGYGQCASEASSEPSVEFLVRLDWVG